MNETMSTPSTGRGHRAPAGEGDRLRFELMEAAEARLAEKGYHGMSLRQVARDVGVSATSVYLHFASKEALVVEVCNRRFGQLAQAINDAMASETEPLARIEACGRAYLRFAIDHPEQYSVMFGGDIPLGELKAQVEGGELLGFTILAGLADVVADGIEQGVVREGDPTQLAYTMWAAVHGLVEVLGHTGAPPMAPEPDQLAESSLAFIMRGLRPD